MPIMLKNDPLYAVVEMWMRKANPDRCRPWRAAIVRRLGELEIGFYSTADEAWAAVRVAAPGLPILEIA